MPIPITNVGLRDHIRAEFGGPTTNVSLSSYRRGGVYVPIGQGDAGYGLISTTANVATGPFRNQGSAFTFNDIVSVNTPNYNLASRAALAGWNGVVPLNATITINSGIYVYSTSTGSPAFQMGTITGGSTVTLTNNGIIAGMGGVGGNGGGFAGASLFNGAGGSVGGLAFNASYPIFVYNNGTIGGGGGGGGGGGAGYNADKSGTYGASGGGGGGGRVNAAGGANGFGSGNTVNAIGNSGSIGSFAAAGAGGVGGVVAALVNAGAGGLGGTLGSPGAAGGLSTIYSTRSLGGAGGAAGGAITGGTNISWYVFGTRLGTIDNAGTNLTGGSVSLPGAGLMDVSGFYLSAAPRSVWINFNNNGTIQGYTHGNVLQWTYNWHTPTSAGIGASYWIRATLASGLAPSSGPAMGVWTSLNTTPGWTYTSPGGFNSRTGSLTIDISATAGGAVIATGTATFQVETEL